MPIPFSSALLSPIYHRRCQRKKQECSQDYRLFTCNAKIGILSITLTGSTNATSVCMCVHIFEERQRLIIYNSVQDGSSLAAHQIQSPKIVAAMFKVNVAYRKKNLLDSSSHQWCPAHLQLGIQILDSLPGIVEANKLVFNGREKKKTKNIHSSLAFISTQPRMCLEI